MTESLITEFGSWIEGMPPFLNFIIMVNERVELGNCKSLSAQYSLHLPDRATLSQLSEGLQN